MNMNFFINSPLEQFEVTSLIGINFPIFGYINFSLTNFGLYTIISVFLVIGLHYFGNNNKNIIPSKWSIALESSYATMHGLVKAQIGPKNEQYLPFIYSLFFFLLFANLNGNIPYGFTITTSIIASIGFSVIIFLGVTILGLRLHKVHFFSFFIPSGTPLALVPLLVPIEIISYVARAFSLGVRIFSNMVGGHVLMKVFSSFVAPIVSSGIILAVVSIAPIILFTILVGLEIAVSFIQSFVFTILTASYLKDAIDLH